MEYAFYSVVVICLAILAYQQVEKRQPPPSDPEELMEARATIEAQEKELEYLRKYSDGSDSELRQLQHKFVDVVKDTAKALASK